MIAKTVLGLFAFFLAGCSSVEMIGDVPKHSVSSEGCSVTVYQTMNQALKKGPIEELCVISGTSSGSFSHTVSTAIEKHKSKACKCGASNVYIQSQRDGTLDVASVTMVAFRFSGQKPAPESSPEVFKRAKLCQAKGGVWVNDVCQIPLD